MQSFFQNHAFLGKLRKIKQNRCITQSELKLKYSIIEEIPEKGICLDALALFQGRGLMTSSPVLLIEKQIKLRK